MDRNVYQLRGVTHYYDTRNGPASKVLDIDRLDVAAGSILGLSGPNGSGKSTLLKLLSFAMRPTTGDILFDGRPESPMSPRVRSKVTLLTQRPYLLKRTVLENVLYGLKVRKDTRDLKSRAARAMAAVGLDFKRFHNRSWHELSGGEAQRVAMAARLILKPKALLLDEPVASVDTQSAQLLRQASLAARDAWGCTLIIVSHDLIWLNECSDTRISMANGKIFSTRRESIIPPPYDQKNGVCFKSCRSGEQILLPPGQGDAAVIGHDSIRIVLPGVRLQDRPGLNQDLSGVQPDACDNRVTARILQMILEEKTDRVLTTFCLDSFSITIDLSPDQVQALSLQPGKEVLLMFDSSKILWR